MNQETRTMVRGWIADRGGNLEAVARWMQRSLHIGTLAECRALVLEATLES